MPITKLNIDEFIAFAANNPVSDVRSPGEYAHAHIPGAVSLAIFNDEERKIIGTSYKQESREKAIKLGLESFGRNMVKIVEAVEKLLADKKSASREIGVHCWRGGMRSGAIAWLLDLYGFKVYLLSGGYKAYRTWALAQFEKNYPVLIVGGYSGSDKTGIISELKRNGEPVIDLEHLAAHMGSAFGKLEHKAQPTQEHFENLLAQDLHIINPSGPVTRIWVEAESQRIGNINIPLSFFNTMRESRIFFLHIPFEKRVKHIVAGYSNYEKASLVNSILRIKKRLGGLETKTAVNFLLEDDLENCFAVLLKYYDKVYLKSTVNRDNAEQLITNIDSETLDCKLNMEKILTHVHPTT